MTNANVDLVIDGVKGRVMSLSYKGGGKQKALIPPNTPIVTIVKAGKANLVPGAHIFAVTKRATAGSICRCGSRSVSKVSSRRFNKSRVWEKLPAATGI